MDSTSRVKLIIIGLILAAIVVGYFVLAQRFQANKTTSTLTQQTPIPTATARILVASPLATPGKNIVAASPTSQNNNRNLQTLPKTGLPEILLGVFSLSAIISGWFLRKFPN